jgi:hypothetical protein
MNYAYVKFIVKHLNSLQVEAIVLAETAPYTIG